MAIDTKLPIIHKQKQYLQDTRRDAPELQCQLPTQPARIPFYKRTPNNCSQIVYQTKRNNLISIPDKCEVCCSVGKVIAHHPDYHMPLYVIWLCRICHGRLHLGKLMTQMQQDCPPEIFESDNEKLIALETTWEESIHIVNNECYIKGTLQTAII